VIELFGKTVGLILESRRKGLGRIVKSCEFFEVCHRVEDELKKKSGRP
jgi:hypothetical protein